MSAHVFEAALATGEELLWQGRPSTALFYWRWLDLYFLPFGVLLTALMGLPTLLPNSPESPYQSQDIPLGLGFVMLGLYLVLGRYIVDWQRRLRTFYAVTGRRVLLKRPFAAVTFLNIGPELETSVEGATVWSLRIGKKPFDPLLGEALQKNLGLGPYGIVFERVKNAHALQELIRDLQNKQLEV